MKTEKILVLRILALGLIFGMVALLSVGSAVFVPNLWAKSLLAGEEAGGDRINEPCLEDDSGELDIEGIKARVDERILVPVRIQHAPCSVSAFGFEVTYPEQGLEFVGFEAGELAGAFDPLEVIEIAPGRLRGAGISTTGGLPKGASGCLLRLSFQAKEKQQQAESQEIGSKNPEQKGLVGLPNPASVYCLKNGGRLEIREDEKGNQYGVCIFSDGSECDEWAYFRGECQPAGQKSECYPLRLENLKDDFANFSSSQGCLCLSRCPGADLNNDGYLTPEDALIAFRCYLKSGPCSECADVDNNGRVTPGDALCIFKTYLGLPSCLNQQGGGAAAAPIRMEGEWKSQNHTDTMGKLIIDREEQTVDMFDSPWVKEQGSLVNFLYIPTGGSAPISFQANFADGSIVGHFSGTAANSLCPPGVWCIWVGQFVVEGSYSLKDNLGQLLDEGTFTLKYPTFP